MVDIERHSRHILLPQVGVEGQSKISKSKIICIGAGGLGSPIIQYLAAAGVGQLTIIDDDKISLSNLQRQTISLVYFKPAGGFVMVLVLILTPRKHHYFLVKRQ